MTAEALLADIFADLPPPVRAWAERKRDMLLAGLHALIAETGQPEPLPESGRFLDAPGPPGGLLLDSVVEHRASVRTRANLAALQVLAAASPDHVFSRQEQETLAAYSGWGGLSLDGVTLPPGFSPMHRGLIHEFYTPPAVTLAVAHTVHGVYANLPRHDNHVLALEPSAGIGRFIRAFARRDYRDLVWYAAEYSEVSARILRALRPDVHLLLGPFERWAMENEALRGKFGLVLMNPPYSDTRGAEAHEDSAGDYARDTTPQVYFIRRGLDFLAPNGLGVVLVSAPFLTGGGMRAVRESVLRRHHLLAAYRLPSGLFPGTEVVTDLVFFIARGGELVGVLESDADVAAGRYFVQFPENILGEEYIPPDLDTDRFAYRRHRVKGTFRGLPRLQDTWRPLEAAQVRPINIRMGGKRAKLGVGEEPIARTGEAPRLAALGDRVGAFLTALGNDIPTARTLWPELHGDLQDLAKRGNPHTLWRQSKDPAIIRLLAAFQPDGHLVPALRALPELPVPRFAPDDVGAAAQWLWAHRQVVRAADLVAATSANAVSAWLEQALMSGAWCFDLDDQVHYIPTSEYLVGALWPKWDTMMGVIQDLGSPEMRAQAQRQADMLLAVIAPMELTEADILPTDAWLPSDLLGQWMVSMLSTSTQDSLREELAGTVRDAVTGMIGPRSGYSTVPELPEPFSGIYGWLNADWAQVAVSRGGRVGLSDAIFSGNPQEDYLADYDAARQREMESAAAEAAGKKTGPSDLGARRQALILEWTRQFQDWLAGQVDVLAALSWHRARQVQGWVEPAYSTLPLKVPRWGTQVTLRPWQNAGARRLVANRRGMLAFDVGVGKTFTACATIAQARAEGWCRRPIIVAPRSLLFMWRAELARALPDYRVGIIGAEETRRGSRTDTPEERGAKWLQFAAGSFDVMIVSYQALGRTQMHQGTVMSYVNRVGALRREIEMAQERARRSAKKRKTPKEGMTRADAQKEVSLEAFVAGILALPRGQRFDVGVTWEDLGIDLIVVDEAQNFKNLFGAPMGMDGSSVKFIGNVGEGAKIAWQLDFRAGTVRERNDGAGVVLLSATPAKNSPMEFYNLFQYFAPDAWRRAGISNSVDFFYAFIATAPVPYVNTKLDLVLATGAVGFKNLDVLRNILYRYGEFKTAEDVGLELPKPIREMEAVPMTAEQAARYQELLRLMRSPDKELRKQRMGFFARMVMVATHPGLEHASDYDYISAQDAVKAHTVNPWCPKYGAVARNVQAATHCGHVIFHTNVAGHAWLRAVLIDQGIPEDRIAVVNADTTNAVDRQDISDDFNGDWDDESGTWREVPKYDVVIANQVAHEGMNLQKRTCAIHHVDLPWEPATLQQRNGRAVRQGNRLESVTLYYYTTLRSADAKMLNMIEQKRGWMNAVLKGQDRETNNPGNEALSVEDLLVLTADDPAAAAQAQAFGRAKAEARARRVQRTDAFARVMSISQRFRGAARVAAREELAQAEVLRGTAMNWLRGLRRDVDPDIFPWLPLLENALLAGAAIAPLTVRTQADVPLALPTVDDPDLVVPALLTIPVYPGMWVRVEKAYSKGNPGREATWYQVGQIAFWAMGVRAWGSVEWKPFTRSVWRTDFQLAPLVPGDYTTALGLHPSPEELPLLSLLEKSHKEGSLDLRSLGWGLPSWWAPGPVWDRIQEYVAWYGYGWWESQQDGRVRSYRGSAANLLPPTVENYRRAHRATMSMMASRGHGRRGGNTPNMRWFGPADGVLPDGVSEAP